MQETKKKEFEDRRKKLAAEKEAKKNPNLANKTATTEVTSIEKQEAAESIRKKQAEEKAKNLEERKKVIEEKRKAAEDKRKKIIEERAAAKKAAEEKLKTNTNKN